MPRASSCSSRRRAHRRAAIWSSRCADVQSRLGFDGASAGRGVDIVVSLATAAARVIKVKADPYFGTDPAKIARSHACRSTAPTPVSSRFEAVANSATREPGWMLDSDADELYYYYLALAQTEDEVRALSRRAATRSFFSETQGRARRPARPPDGPTRAWFDEHADTLSVAPRRCSRGTRRGTVWSREPTIESALERRDGSSGPIFAGLRC